MFSNPAPWPLDQIFDSQSDVDFLNVLVVFVILTAVALCAAVIIRREHERQVSRRVWDTYLYREHYHWRHYTDEINAEIERHKGQRNDSPEQ